MQQYSWPGADFDRLCHRAVRLLQAGGRSRRILGIAGAPASGKSTLAGELRDRLAMNHPGRVAVVGLDAFHLAQRILDGHGLAEVKGAPQTFDPAGYGELLRRLRRTRETVYAPKFDRGIEDPIAQAIEVTSDVNLVITEGNYLLLEHYPWCGLTKLLDETWMISLDDTVRRRRLIARHQEFGRDKSEAEARTLGTDERNAVLVNQSSITPDVRITHVATSGEAMESPSGGERGDD